MKRKTGASLWSRFRAGLCAALACFLAGGPGAAAALAAEPPGITFDLAVTRGATPVLARVLQVAKDDLVRLRVTSEVAGELHLHAYRLEVKVVPGTPSELEFRARAAGRFRIEWHAAADRTKKADHHGPALAILEVRPK